MAPESFPAALTVTLTGVVPSVSRTTALVVQPAGAAFAWTCNRVMVTALSSVQLDAVQVEVNAPGRNTFCSARGLEVITSEFNRNCVAAKPLLSRIVCPAAVSPGTPPPHVPKVLSMKAPPAVVNCGIVPQAPLLTQLPSRRMFTPFAPAGNVAGSVMVTV